MFSDRLIRECLGLPVEQISLEVLLKPYCLKPRNGPWLELMMAIIWKEVTKQDPKWHRDLADLEMRWLCWALKFFNQWDYKCFWMFCDARIPCSCVSRLLPPRALGIVCELSWDQRLWKAPSCDRNDIGGKESLPNLKWTQMSPLWNTTQILSPGPSLV